jgi:hypothetical protein
VIIMLLFKKVAKSSKVLTQKQVFKTQKVKMRIAQKEREKERLIHHKIILSLKTQMDMAT